MTKILVPLDGTSFSEKALPVADRMAQDQGAELVLLSVTELPETSEQADIARRQAEQSLLKIAEGLRSPTTVRVAQTGDPVRGILRVVEEVAPDQIVMASSDPSGLEAAAEGSVTDEVKDAVSIPVTVVTPEDGS